MHLKVVASIAQPATVSIPLKRTAAQRLPLPRLQVILVTAVGLAPANEDSDVNDTQDQDRSNPYSAYHNGGADQKIQQVHSMLCGCGFGFLRGLRLPLYAIQKRLNYLLKVER
jgi:hypothetical protein